MTQGIPGSLYCTSNDTGNPWVIIQIMTQGIPGSLFIEKISVILWPRIVGGSMLGVESQSFGSYHYMAFSQHPLVGLSWKLVEKCKIIFLLSSHGRFLIRGLNQKLKTKNRCEVTKIGYMRGIAVFWVIIYRHVF